ncbi:MAG: hypothetical protein ACI39T_01150 [Candidatus Cryptobacteroides sp.]
MTPSPRGDGSEMVVEVGSVPKDDQKNTLPREDATEASVGRVVVPKPGQKNALPRDNLYPMGPAHFPCAREHTPL